MLLSPGIQLSTIGKLCYHICPSLYHLPSHLHRPLVSPDGLHILAPVLHPLASTAPLHITVPPPHLHWLRHPIRRFAFAFEVFLFCVLAPFVYVCPLFVPLAHQLDKRSARFWFLALCSDLLWSCPPSGRFVSCCVGPSAGHITGHIVAAKNSKLVPSGLGLGP